MFLRLKSARHSPVGEPCETVSKSLGAIAADADADAGWRAVTCGAACAGWWQLCWWLALTGARGTQRHEAQRWQNDLVGACGSIELLQAPALCSNSVSGFGGQLCGQKHATPPVSVTNL
jgi:hypothetical protein